MSIWSVYRNTLIITFAFYSLRTFFSGSVKSSYYYSVFLVSQTPVVFFRQTSVLSGLFCKISHGPSESRALFTGHSSCGAPVVFLHIGHILCSALVSQLPPNQLSSLVIQVRFPITVHLLPTPPPPPTCCVPWRLAGSHPHFKNAEVNFHLAFCGLFCTGIGLTLSEPHPTQPLYPA